ncbi:hypothetical protein XaC1_462 [Xanthomonas phage XaC1]|nr:hypothetical protein XaC1_462 [Xanthomonas phage XaC1]
MQIKTIETHLRLMKYYLKNDNMCKHSDDSDITDYPTLEFKSERISLSTQVCNRIDNTYSTLIEVRYGTVMIMFGTEYYNTGYMYVHNKPFSKENSLLTVPRGIETIDDFFNYILVHDTPYFEYDIIPVLNEIVVLVTEFLKLKCKYF